MEGGPPGFGPGFTCPALLGILVAVRSGFAYGALTRCGRPFHAVPLPSRTCARGRQPRKRGPATPSAEPCLPGMPARRFGHRSPFARRYSGSLEIDFLSSGYLDVSVPRVVLPPPMCSAGGYAHCCAWVRPFGDPPGRRMCAPRRGLSQLAASFIGSLCQGIRRAPWYLAGPHRARGISTCR